MTTHNPNGVKIVLTSPESEISKYSGDPFAAFISVFPEKVIPRPILKPEWFEPNDNSDGSAKFVPYGLRKIESLLLREFPREDIVVAHPRNLHRFVGPNTKIVGISSMDPMGLAYVSITYNSMIAVPGDSVDAVRFKKLMNNRALKKYDPFIVLGGPGAWQARHAGLVEEMGIDLLVHGEAELIVADTFKKILAGEKLPEEITGSKVPMDSIATIQCPASYGVVEITRGCGRGCQFCSPTNRRRHSLPLDHIMKEVEVNIKGGNDSIFLATEDMFLYQCGSKFEPNAEALEKLLTSIGNYPGVEFIHLSHIAIAPAVHSPKMIERISPILMEKTRYTPKFRSNYRKPFITALFGIESGSVRIMKKYMRGKIWPFDIERYHEVVVQGTGILNDNGWRPMATLMTGWPDETKDDTLKTLELLDKLKGHEMFLVPLLFIPLEDTKLRDEHIVSLEKLTDEQWDVFATSWRFNIDIWDPKRQPFFTFAALFSYFAYFRWKHGPKVWKPIAKIAGIPSKFPLLGVGSCDPRLCADSTEHPEIRTGLTPVTELGKPEQARLKNAPSGMPRLSRER